MTGDKFPFPDEDDDNAEDDGDKRNAAFAQMRKDNKTLRQEVEELRVFKEEQEKVLRLTSLEAVAKEIGLNPKRTKFYPADAEATPEAMKAWALAEELISAEEGEDATVPEPPAQAGFTPTVVPGGSTPGAKIYTPEEFDQLMEVDPMKAMQVYKAGRVQKDSAPGGSRFVGRDK